MKPLTLRTGSAIMGKLTIKLTWQTKDNDSSEQTPKEWAVNQSDKIE